MHTISPQPGFTLNARRALHELTRRLRGAHRRWRRARQADATARVLTQLDDRLLHDLGLDRSELLSTAAELHGQAARERRHTVLLAPQPR